MEADGVVAGAFSVKVVDTSAPTIGKSVLCKSTEALQAGTCVTYDSAEASMTQADGKSVVVKTTAVSAKSKVFVTPKIVTDQPLAVTKIIPGVSFSVEVKNSVTENTDFDWFIVEEK
ncbi:MAG: hypothetical protein NTY33_02850 [Candidatus Moranbacteria bacterium]|nr:hypothetical protein [Candidatus Moranbacteria bacterium]